MSMGGFPLLLIPLAIYNIIVFLMPGVSFTDPVLKLTLMSGAEWQVTLSDMLLALAILMLMFEVIKGARPGAKYLTDHLLSLLVFGGAAAEFLLWPRFGGSTFFLLTLLALVDFLTGIALRTRRAARMASSPAVRARHDHTADAEPHEPRLVPTPEPAAPRTAPVVESVSPMSPQPKATEPEILHPEIRHHEEEVHPEILHPEVADPEILRPEVPHPEVAPKASSPEVASPGLQPRSSSTASPDDLPRDPRP